MRENKQFASRMAVALAVAALVGTSAFAETRHSKETSAGDGRDSVASIQSLGGNESQNEARSNSGRIERRSDRNGDRADDRAQSRDRGQNRDRAAQSRDRDQSRDRAQNRDRSQNRDRAQNRDRDDSYRDRSRSDRNRGNDRSYESNRNRSRSDHRQPHWAQGRVSRVQRHGAGYRVFVHGARYPFFVPDRYYHRDRFRIGVDIRLGGYYNPGGYYDYYDGRYASSRADLQGVVESVDYSRNTFVMRNEATGSFVTVIMRDRRRDLRAGDYVEVFGDWSRNGLFQARDIDLLDQY